MKRKQSKDPLLAVLGTMTDILDEQGKISAMILTQSAFIHAALLALMTVHPDAKKIRQLYEVHFKAVLKTLKIQKRLLGLKGPLERFLDEISEAPSSDNAQDN